MKLLVIGGVAGGASAAARARRLDEYADIILFERGAHVSFANCGLPYHIGGVITERDRLLVQTPESLHARLNLDVRVRSEVTAIDRAAKTVSVRDLARGHTYTEFYDALVLSPGAEPIRPPLPGIDLPQVKSLRSLDDMDAIKAVVDNDKPAHAVVIGGGYIGLEMAEALRACDVRVTLVELAPQVMGPADPEIAAPLHDELLRHGVDLRLNTSVTGFAARDGALDVSLSTGAVLTCGLAVLAIGVKPEVALARAAGLQLGARGGIAVDAHMRTSDPHIYAVGDAVEIVDFVTDTPALIPLAGPANRQGRIAADNIFGRAHAYKKTQGTAICKVFDLAVGMTGASEKLLARLKRPCETITVHPSSHASYYPGAHLLTLKVMFDPETGALLGAQAVGRDGVDKRIDVLATAIRAGLSVYDLEDLELSYAPPYGSAKDPVNYAGFVAANALRGDVRICHVADVLKPGANEVVLDVRTPEEFAAGRIPGAINVPVDDLRARIGELAHSKEYLVYCRVGLRGYLACRVLMQHGLACRNLSGGYLTYRAATWSAPAPAAALSEKSDRSDLSDLSDSLPAQTLDARGLQCPGPIMRVKTALDALQPGQVLKVLSTDCGFGKDIAGWCASMGHTLISVTQEKGDMTALIQKQATVAPATAPAAGTLAKNKTIVVFSGDFDKAMAAFIIANGAAAMGSNVTLFFTFWGLNIIRKPQRVAVRKPLLDRMFGMMMPRGAARLQLSKMNMGGMGAAMIKWVMQRKRVDSLPELIASARAAGVRLVACTMSMDVMGIKREELLDGIEEGGVAAYLHSAEAGNVNLFI
jgi:NADPH-dependent 2,4-dienoyl-CoA reductase/sulfur reductase-like enzyme/peroxiredoxin family protein/TusA-related sulfurtransferase/rhodanese-related sulfurtransferase